MGDDVRKFGAWRAVESDPGYDGGAPSISATVNGCELALVLSHGDRSVAALAFDADDGEEISVHDIAVTPWTRTAVLCVLEAVASVAIAQLEALPCPVCAGVRQGNTCCPGGPDMAELANALDSIAIERGWWGEQIPESQHPDCMTPQHYARWIANARGVTTLPGDDLVVVKAR